PNLRKISGEVLIFKLRPPPPRMIQSAAGIRSSMYKGMPGGSDKGVTPPTCIPVRAIISSADANDAFDTPINSVTAWFTPRRVCASTTHATYFFGSFLDATMIVLQECSTG